VSDGRKAPARTYQDLLKNKYDEDLFDWYLLSEVTRIDVLASPQPQFVKLSPPLVVRSLRASPDGTYLLQETMHRPYSYVVPYSRFPRLLELRRTSNGSLAYTVADIPLLEQIPIAFDAVQEGPRNFGFRQDHPATLYWVEAQDKGDPSIDVPVRDILYTLSAPFDAKSSPNVLAKLNLRYDSTTWCSDELCLVTESWWKTRRTKTYVINPSTGEVRTAIFDRQYEDRYSDPGSPILKRLPNGAVVLMLGKDQQTVYLSGDGASSEGDKPFLDTFNLFTGETKRIWQNTEEGVYERPTIILGDEAPVKLVLTRRESKNTVPNFWIRDLDDTTLRQITFYPHPYPDLANCHKELIRYQRKDGVQLTATLYLPPGYDPARDGPLPALLWAYPREFKSADAAGQVTDSLNRFVRLARAPLYWLTQGYVVLDNPALPIVAEGSAEPNDTFLEQLVAGAQAAVDELVRRGVADPNRVAVGGHSYGAFMAANLLAHSRIFRTAICRSGAYNRTLTPWGFQSEERSLWEAQEIYAKMSVFNFANRIKDPILLIHGEADNNPGTFTMQSERMFQALKGHGVISKLVILPAESHGYQARESVLHQLHEITEWLDKYCKNASPQEIAEPAPASTSSSR